MIHPETHFTDEKAGPLRAETYPRLRRHWQFINELSLFEIHHLVSYGVHIYGTDRESRFFQATSLYHPETIVRSFAHDGSGVQPGLKDAEGNWDLRPHRDRIILVTPETLKTWHKVLEDESVPVLQSRMVYAVNRATAEVLSKLASAPRMGELGLQFSRGWDESIDRKKGFFDSEWGRPASWDDVILQGPNLHIGLPFFKYPNPSMLHNQDWTLVDLEALEPDAIPITSYKPRGDRAKYDASYTHWQTAEPDGSSVAARTTYRLAWRKMAANTGERTLISAIIPPGAAHIDGVYTLSSLDGGARELALIAASFASMLTDFSLRSAPRANIRTGTAERLPIGFDERTAGPLVLRIMRLTSLTSAFSSAWFAAWAGELEDSWTGGIDYQGRPALADVGSAWTRRTSLRRASDRRQALVEIDALVAITLGVTIDELCTIYRTQFPVLAGYDRDSYIFDANGRVVPTSVLSVWRRKGDASPADERTATHPGSGISYVYDLPFVRLDREQDLRAAYEEFGKRLTNSS